MSFQLYTDVVLVSDLLAENLHAGDVGTVVEQYNVTGLETGYSVEFVGMLGETVAVVTLPGSALRPPTHADRPAVHPTAVTS